MDGLGDLGVDKAVHPELHAEGELVAAAELGALETGADRALAGLAALAVRSPSRLGDWIGPLGLDATRRVAPDRPARTATLGAAVLAPAEPVLLWVGDLRHQRLAISGDDLVEAGIAPGPAVGAALEETLRRTLDGDVEGRDEQFDLALRVAREGS